MVALTGLSRVSAVAVGEPTRRMAFAPLKVIGVPDPRPLSASVRTFAPQLNAWNPRGAATLKVRSEVPVTVMVVVAAVAGGTDSGELKVPAPLTTQL